MKRVLTLLLVLLVAAAGVYLAQRTKHIDTVNPIAILDSAADVQRDLSRVPMRVTRLPDGDEIRIGDELAARYQSVNSSNSTMMQPFENFVVKVGNRVAAGAHRRLPYRFHLVADPDLFNAFALPGGHVFVGFGLLKQMASEDELACVIGHEIEHIDHYHAAERIQVEAQLKRINLDGIAGLALIPLELWQAGYSKDQELEADHEGLLLATAAGYSPQGALNFFERWSELHREYITHAGTPVGELSQTAIEGLHGYFRSHPEPEERLEQARKVIEEEGLDTSIPLTPLAVSSKLQSQAYEHQN